MEKLCGDLKNLLILTKHEERFAEEPKQYDNNETDQDRQFVASQRPK